MIYLFSVAAGLVGGFAAVLLLSGRRPRRRREGKQSRRKIECSKLVLWAVLCTYFAGFGVGVWAVVLDVSQLGVFLAYVGTPTGNGHRLLFVESKGGKRCENQKGKPGGNGGNAR